jgi:Zn(2)-Cys(6) binuclear cluster domain-containing protein
MFSNHTVLNEAASSQLFTNHSFHETADTNATRGIAIPGTSVCHQNPSPYGSYYNPLHPNMNNETSYDSIGSSHVSESFPSYDDTQFFLSPTSSFDLKQSYTTCSLDSAVDMNRTESVLSNESLQSQEADEPVFEDDNVSVCATIGDFGDSTEPTSWRYPYGAMTGKSTRCLGGRSKPTSKAALPKIALPKKKLGRTRKLSAAERDSTAHMRRIGACVTCKDRKLKCDDGIPCQRCIKYWGDQLPTHPCRGDQLHAIAEFIMSDNVFPKKGYERFLANIVYTVGAERWRINLDLGFGPAFPCDVKLIHATDENGNHPFFHKHIDYKWPPPTDGLGYEERFDFVFPAILADTTNIERIVDQYLTSLIENMDSFRYFPLWKSDLSVLRKIYLLYLSLPRVSPIGVVRF